MIIPNASKCTVCGDQTHNCENCPTLHEPTKQGFYKPSGGGHSLGDDDDEKVDIKHKPNLKFKYQYEKAKL
jgi:hypothetical protein